MATTVKFPDHELANYRIARKAFDQNWNKKKDGGLKLWERVRNNALRLAEAVDFYEKRRTQVK